jgi:hypothetical protein
VGWAMLYLFVFLKLPIAALCWIVWWAVHQTDEESTDGSGGYRRPHPPPRLPRAPRRGPHGDGMPLPPPRVRPLRARARRLPQQRG